MTGNLLLKCQTFYNVENFTKTKKLYSGTKKIQCCFLLRSIKLAAILERLFTHYLEPSPRTPSFSDEKTGTHISNLPRSANGYRKLDRKLLLYPVVLPSPTSALVSDTQMERHLASSPREELKMLVPPRVQQGPRLSRLGWCHPLAASWQDPGQGCTQSQ